MSSTAAAWCLGALAAIVLTAIGLNAIVVIAVILTTGVIYGELEREA